MFFIIEKRLPSCHSPDDAGDCCYIYCTDSTGKKIQNLFLISGLFKSSLNSCHLTFCLNLKGHTVLFNVSVKSYFFYLMVMHFKSFHLIPWKLLNHIFPFHWLMPFNGEIPLMLWKLSIDFPAACDKEMSEKTFRKVVGYTETLLMVEGVFWFPCNISLKWWSLNTATLTVISVKRQSFYSKTTTFSFLLRYQDPTNWLSQPCKNCLTNLTNCEEIYCL